MTAFRILDQDPVYRDAQDNMAANGHLRFYVTGTTTPKDVFGDKALTINNGPSILIGTDGRAVNDIWGKGDVAYRVRLYDSADALVWERDDVDIAASGSTLPAFVSGQFLTNNGSVAQWAPIIQVPDPTGQSGKVLGNNGLVPIWQALTVVNANATITFVTGGFKISDGTNARMIQFGSGTVPAAGSSQTSSTTITFGTAFTNPPVVFAEINGSSGVANPIGGIPSHGVAGVGTTSCVFAIDTNGFASPTVNITLPVPFYWWALGTVAP